MCRGADCILWPAFWSDRHEVKIPPLPADPHSNLYFFSIYISHCCHLRHIRLFPFVFYIVCLCISSSSTFYHQHSIYSNLSSHLCSNLTLPCQYLSGQLFLCIQTALTNIVHKEQCFHMKWGRNQLSKREQMVILSWWHLLALAETLHCLFHPSLFQHTWGITTSSETFYWSLECAELLALYLSPESTVSGCEVVGNSDKHINRGITFHGKTLTKWGLLCSKLKQTKKANHKAMITYLFHLDKHARIAHFRDKSIYLGFERDYKKERCQPANKDTKCPQEKSSDKVFTETASFTASASRVSAFCSAE